VDGVVRSHYPSVKAYRDAVCTGKIQHPNPVEAFKALRNLVVLRLDQRPDRPLQVYVCPFGGHYHVGHKPKRGGKFVCPVISWKSVEELSSIATNVRGIGLRERCVNAGLIVPSKLSL
jgi:hypothetical protein